jgi:hypothetical protein
MRLLHRWICWLLPLIQTLSLALFSLSLPRGSNDEGQPKKHLLLSYRRLLLLNFLLHSSVVHKSVGFLLSSTRTTWFLPETLGAYMLSKNFLQIGSLVLPNSRWNRWVKFSTRTVLRRWGLTTNFAWSLLLFLRVFILLTGSQITIEWVLATHHIFVDRAVTWIPWVPAFCEPCG